MSTCTTGLGGLVLGASAVPFLTSCAQMDRLIVGDAANERKRVVILGGGLSGLVAARELKKSGVPFRLFEASDRMGGRILTLNGFNPADQVVDLGAEWFSEDDDFVLNLCREFKIDTQDIPWTLREPHGFSGASFNTEVKNLEKKLASFKASIPEQTLDHMSVSELFDKVVGGASSEARRMAEATVLLQWGESSHKLSALYFLDRRGDDLTGWKYLRGRKWRVVGGAGVLTEALYDKVAGVVPDQIVVRKHRLMEISEKKDHLELGFMTPNGQISVEAEVVICTLPWTVLREINGIENLVSVEKQRAILNLSYGTHGKVAASYTDRFWAGNGSTWVGGDANGSNWMWDAAPVVQNFIPMRRGVLAAQYGGRAGAELGPQTLESFKAEAARINPRKAVESEYAQMMNWSLNPLSKGSVPYLAPGQVHSFSETLNRAERKGKLIFAGDHTSYASHGSMNGAIESGLRAALEATKFKEELSKISVI